MTEPNLTDNQDLVSKAQTPPDLSVQKLNTEINESDIEDIAERETLDIDKAINLRFIKGLSYGEIGTLLNTPKSTVYKRLKDVENLIKDPAHVQAFKRNKSEFLNAGQMLAFREVIDEEKLKKVSTKDAAVTQKILWEMERAERGENIGVYEYHTVTARLEDLKKEEDRLQRELDGN